AVQGEAWQATRGARLLGRGDLTPVRHAPPFRGVQHRAVLDCAVLGDRLLRNLRHTPEFTSPLVGHTQATVHHLVNLVAVVEYLVVVGDHHAGHVELVALAGEQLHDLLGAATIQGRGRLVVQQHLRVTDQRPGDAHALPLTT